jgi:hypothetical protein
MIADLHQAHAAVLGAIDEEDRLGPPDLQEIFETRLTQNLRRFPLLRRKMNSSILFVVEGEQGGPEVDLRRTSNWFAREIPATGRFVLRFPLDCLERS